jgi:hypothetical protein
MSHGRGRVDKTSANTEASELKNIGNNLYQEARKLTVSSSLYSEFLIASCYLGRFYVRAGQPLHPNKMIVFRTTPPIYYTTYETKTSENDYDL